MHVTFHESLLLATRKLLPFFRITYLLVIQAVFQPSTKCLPQRNRRFPNAPQKKSSARRANARSFSKIFSTKKGAFCAHFSTLASQHSINFVQVTQQLSAALMVVFCVNTTIANRRFASRDLVRGYTRLARHSRQKTSHTPALQNHPSCQQCNQ